jgi:hypothetical protein
MHKFFVTTIVILSLLGVSCQAKDLRDDYIGNWIFLGGDKAIDIKHSLLIVKDEKNLLITYTDQGAVYSGNLQLNSKSGTYIGLLQGYGKVQLSKVESISEFRNNAISMELINQTEDIEIGFFQEKSVLEKLLKKKLP